MATSKTPKSSNRAIRRLVRRQHGVIARRQLIVCGLTSSAIRHRLGTGRLFEVRRGVYAVGRPELSRHGRWMAAVLACGQGALLSHLPAAVLMKMLDRGSDLIHITLPGRSSSRQPGIELHRPTCLPLNDTGSFEGIPVTSPVRTLIDLATLLPSGRLERAVSEAEILDLISLEELRAELGGRAGQRGVPALRELIDRHTFALTRSELEQRFLSIARRAGLPLPETGAHVNGFEVDFLFRELGLVVETDGGRFHRSAMKQTRDRRREHAHISAGLLPLRFTQWQVRHAPAQVVETLRSAARQRDATVRKAERRAA